MDLQIPVFFPFLPADIHFSVSSNAAQAICGGWLQSMKEKLWHRQGHVQVRLTLSGSEQSILCKIWWV